VARRDEGRTLSVERPSTSRSRCTARVGLAAESHAARASLT
jgi:hypothetical protein